MNIRSASHSDNATTAPSFRPEIDVAAAKPFVKWAGGKGQLLGQLEALLPKDFADRKSMTYVEPFVGGGAMLFHVLAKYRNVEHAVVNDLNGDLVTCYRTVKEEPEELISLLGDLQKQYRALTSEKDREELYFRKRDRYNSRQAGTLETAALFVFLNRTCFNGLHRVNSKGFFNVPFGKNANPCICDEDRIRADSLLLRKVDVLCGDFEQVTSALSGPAFFYFDPPYRPLTQTSSFTAYSKEGFGDDQQARLARFCRQLDAAGHQWLLSNSDPHNADPGDDFFETLYAGFDVRRVSANRMINSNANKRGALAELAIRNYG